MTTNRRFSQAPPNKANELFDKLLATSGNAIKTRERLFHNLKQELELLATLQEEHLFPVLRRHGMQDLVGEASNDNQETRALLAELERMPKNGSDFLGKVAELRRNFQQHIRDDRKELLPAVLKVLGDEEANAVAEQVEDEMANLDGLKRNEAHRSREQVETVQRFTEDMADTLRTGVESAHTMARAMQEILENSLGAFSDLTRRSTGQAMQALGQRDSKAQEVTEEASHNLRAVAQSSTALTHGLQDISHEAFELSQRRWQKNLEHLNALACCRSVADLAAAQSALVRDNLEQTIGNSRRLAELAIQIADEATRTMTAQAEKSAQRIRRVV
ncbi:phasin family protein [Microvirga puerhi]|uniref:Phasin family protein n=1 Tax=Microvirga puerhi TaxID=2876078 RepID=A0ABS7VV89_9HYPH|nr:phasin family protein [Microvirga puerhi]MBZ6079066.1 phasin family protein [Microvirga puerhi]